MNSGERDRERQTFLKHCSAFMRCRSFSYDNDQYHPTSCNHPRPSDTKKHIFFRGGTLFSITLELWRQKKRKCDQTCCRQGEVCSTTHLSFFTVMSPPPEPAPAPDAATAAGPPVPRMVDTSPCMKAQGGLLGELSRGQRSPLGQYTSPSPLRFGCNPWCTGSRTWREGDATGSTKLKLF